MRYITIFIFTIICTITQAQTYLELSIPMGTSYVTQPSIDRINGVVEPNNIQWSPGFYRGIEGSFAFRISDRMFLKTYANYLILQNNLKNIEERESYSWVYREIHARVNEHNMGMGLYFDYALWKNGRNSISPFIRAGINVIHYYDTYTSETRINYYEPEEQSFEGRISESVLYDDFYLQLGIGIAYKFELSKKLYLSANAGFSHFHNLNDEFQRGDLATDWNSIYGSIGAGWNISNEQP